MSEQRRERREQERANQKPFEALAKEIRASMEDRPDQDEFKVALLTALEVLERDEHPNNLVAAQLLMGCVQAEKRGDALTGRLMMYVAGAVVNETICHATINAILDRVKPQAVSSLPPA